MEPLQGVGQPAVALLHLVDHGGQRSATWVSELTSGIAEQDEKPGEGHEGHGQDHPDRAAPAEPVALEEVDRRVEDQGDEGGDQDPEDDLAEPSEEPVAGPRWR